MTSPSGEILRERLKAARAAPRRSVFAGLPSPGDTPSTASTEFLAPLLSKIAACRPSLECHAGTTCRTDAGKEEGVTTFTVRREGNEPTTLQLALETGSRAENAIQNAAPVKDLTIIVRGKKAAEDLIDMFEWAAQQLRTQMRTNTPAMSANSRPKKEQATHAKKY